LRTGFFWKIFGGTVAVISITAFVVYLVAVPTLARSLQKDTELRVRQETRLAAELAVDVLTGEADPAHLARIERAVEDLGTSRLTIIDTTGRVLLETQADASEMDNHATRPEFMEPGSIVTRWSETVEQDMTYVAQPVRLDGSLLGFARMALPLEDQEGRIADLRRAIRQGSLLAALFSLVLAGIFARRVTKPLTEIADLVSEIGTKQTTRRLDVRREDELGQLARAVNRMADDLQGQIARVERDRAEREAIFSAMADGLLAIDKQQNVLFINQPARHLLGVDEARIKGRPVWELVRNDDIIEVLERCLETEVRSRGESRLHTEDGDRTVELTAVPMAGTASANRGCVLELRDVTDLRRLEAVRRDFVSNVSHELKTPLTAMRGYLEAMLEDKDMPEALRASFIERAHRNTERLAAIVGDLLSLSRLESEEHELAFEPLDVVDLVEVVIGDLRDLADSRRQTVAYESPGGPLEVEADTQALGMAVSNLLSNALQYSPEGEEVRVAVSVDDDEVRIDVVDRGPGIPPEEQERVFERFYRVDKARSRKLGGTGLGLSIVRHVMAAHGGRVELESEPGRGSHFSLFLRRS
jgi:two-component system phosphate regulon sensor histidine kinase PhoR